MRNLFLAVLTTFLYVVNIYSQEPSKNDTVNVVIDIENMQRPVEVRMLYGELQGLIKDFPKYDYEKGLDGDGNMKYRLFNINRLKIRDEH